MEYLNISKAFDTTSHNMLLHKLEHDGVRGFPLDWFKSYLSNRNQYVHVNDVDSSLRNLTCGLPQGYVIGRLLFLTYMNKTGKISKQAKICFYTDDTKISKQATMYFYRDDTKVFIFSDDPIPQNKMLKTHSLTC